MRIRPPTMRSGTADVFCLICNQFQPLYEAAMRRLEARRRRDSNPMLEPAPE